VADRIGVWGTPEDQATGKEMAKLNKKIAAEKEAKAEEAKARAEK
jgi:hypothetical protein